MTVLAYCTVIGKFADFTVDGADGGADPDGAPLVGQVTLTCDARDLGANPTTARLLLPTETPPRTITIEPFPVTLDGTGSFSVEVVASGQTGVTVPSVFTYTASFALKTATGAKVSIAPFSFSAPAGQTVDLALVAPAATNNGVNYIVGPQGAPGLAGTVVVTAGTTAPDHTTVVLWLDTSSTPVLRYWDGSTWAALTTGGGGGGTSGFTWVDNGNGTATVTATGTASAVDNGNGVATLTGGTVTDNNNGTATIAA